MRPDGRVDFSSLHSSEVRPLADLMHEPAMLTPSGEGVAGHLLRLSRLHVGRGPCRRCIRHSVGRVLLRLPRSQLLVPHSRGSPKLFPSSSSPHHETLPSCRRGTPTATSVRSRTSAHWPSGACNGLGSSESSTPSPNPKPITSFPAHTMVTFPRSTCRSTFASSRRECFVTLGGLVRLQPCIAAHPIPPLVRSLCGRLSAFPIAPPFRPCMSLQRLATMGENVQSVKLARAVCFL